MAFELGQQAGPYEFVAVEENSRTGCAYKVRNTMADRFELLLAASHARNVEKLVPVFQALYDTMSEDQKRAADEIFRDDASHPHHGRHNRETNG